MKVYDNIIIGGGQAGLSVAYFFRRHKLDYLILDDKDVPGGSWLDTWDSLLLFSPVQFSSLSGWMMPAGTNVYPSKDEFITYLTEYEKRYKFPVKRPVKVKSVRKRNDLFEIQTSEEPYYSKTLVSATGGAHNPFIPEYPDAEEFKGIQLHSFDYRNPSAFQNKKVLIVGGGNSGAQILAEVSKVANTQWVTLEEPRFLPDDVDGRFLFEEATKKFLNKTSDQKTVFSLGDIVMVQSVKEASKRGVLTARRPFLSFYENGVIWENDVKEPFDAVIWCTGFLPDTDHLAELNLARNGKIPTKNTRSVEEPMLWLVGYGNWTGFASATIYGVGKAARTTAKEISDSLSNP